MTARLRDADEFLDPFTGDRVPYFDHPYNVTRDNERAIEVPIVLDWIARRPFATRGLEVGNVLRHYPTRFGGPGGAMGDPHPWTTVDLHERGDRVLNVDVTNITSITGAHRPPYDWIVTISTLEHVGWDYDPQDSTKALDAIDHLRSCLEPAGQLLVTFPTGHHPYLDAAVDDGSLGEIESAFFRRVDHEDGPATWEPQHFEAIPYRRDVPSAGGVWFGVFDRA